MLIFGLLAVATLQSVSDKAPVDGQADVVVKGERLAKRLKACIDARCPPEQEVEAALDAAVQNFRDGNYRTARTTLRRTIVRNKRYARRMPGKISDLYATFADISLHDGYASAYQNATRSSVDVLRQNVGENAFVTLAARVRIGDMLASSGMLLAADGAYADAARDAVAAGHPRLGELINVRRALLALHQKNPKKAEAFMRSAVARFGSDPAILRVDRAIKVKIARMRNDDAAVDRLLAEWQTGADEAPLLLIEPPMPVMDPIGGEGIGTTFGGGDGDRDVRWVDIGFWVSASGKTEQAEVLRPARASGWAKPLVQQIAKRQYARLSKEAGVSGIYRIERYSLRRTFGMVTGSRILARTGAMEVIRADMTSAGTDAPKKAVP